MRWTKNIVAVYTYTHTRKFTKQSKGEKVFVDDEIKGRLDL